jgi:FAD/FMN-containing dehydrogenase
LPIPIEDASGYQGAADQVFAPATPEEVASILRESSATATPITAGGAGTGVTGGRCPESGWYLSLERFRSLEVRDGRARVGAAVTLQELNETARRTGLFYPPDPTEWTASLGGNISTNASGSRSFLYGSTRQWIESLTVAFLDGSVKTLHRGDRVDFPYMPLPAPKTRKHTAGYRLRENLEWVDLLVGSEGTLAVILEAEVRLIPIPPQLLAGVVFFPQEALALAAVESWRSIPGLRMLESMDRESLKILRPRYSEIPPGAEACLMVEQIGDDVDGWVDRLESAGALAEESWFGDTPADRERFRVFRHALPEIVNDRVRRNGFQKMSTDFAVPIEAGPEMMAFYRQKLDELFPDKHVIFGHIGDAHVHVNLLPETQADVDRGRALIEEFARKSVTLGGTISAEHGLGKKKAWMLPIEFSHDQIQAMKDVKLRLDPHWLLGRGTLFP